LVGTGQPRSSSSAFASFRSGGVETFGPPNRCTGAILVAAILPVVMVVMVVMVVTVREGSAAGAAH
jgi:hypothetical protein